MYLANVSENGYNVNLLEVLNILQNDIQPLKLENVGSFT